MCHFVEQSSGQLDSLLLTRTRIVHEHCVCIELGQFDFNMASYVVPDYPYTELLKMFYILASQCQAMPTM